MGKIWAGFLVGGLVGFVLATAAFSGCQDMEVTTRVFAPGMAFGVPVGGLMGALVGWMLERTHDTREGRSEAPPGKHHCPNCGCQEVDGAKTCRWCGADQG